MKILLTASVLSHIAQFHKPLINMLKEQGHTVHVAAWDNLALKNGLSLDNIDRHFNIAFHRSPFSPMNIPAYRQLRRIIDAETYDIIHCNTPAVGVLTRLAARRSRKKHGTKVFYTAHGFHFYQGAPKKNWLLYYPIEKLMCRYTDTLITICEEDFALAQKRFSVPVFRMHGVGASSERFHYVGEEEKKHLRRHMGLEASHQVVLCIGELLPNKNQATLIRAAALMKPQHPALRVLLAGNGPEEQKLRTLISELKLDDIVHLLGYRSDVENYVKAADIVVSCSIREGLGLNVIEGMLAAKPIVASLNRGHKELIQDGENGFLVPTFPEAAYAEAIHKLVADSALYHHVSLAAMRSAAPYAVPSVLKELRQIYNMFTAE